MRTLIVLAFLSCQLLFGQNIISLTEGNWWKYEFYKDGKLEYEFTKKIVGNKIINNKPYAILEVEPSPYDKFEYWGKDDISSYCIRIDAITYIPFLYNSEAKNGSKFQRYSVELSKETHFGKEFNVQRWQELVEPGVYVSYNLTFAEKLGPVKSSMTVIGGSSSFSECKLIGAYIDGVEYKNVTSIIEPGVTPVEYSLSQNYPNPFNPETVIEYSLTQDSEVTIEIIDINGRLVKELNEGWKTAGKYKFKFKADNLSSGIYFYRLNSNYFSETKKMTVLR